MMDLNRDDNAMRRILVEAKVIAVVGHSANPQRTSYSIAQFLRRAGYKVYAVNPMIQEAAGEPAYASLADVPEPIDIVNVFRRSEHLAQVVEEAVAVGAKAVWAQLGVDDPQAKQDALKAGLAVATNACIKIEYFRLRIDRG